MNIDKYKTGHRLVSRFYFATMAKITYTNSQDVFQKNKEIDHMPTPEAIQSEKERIWESASLRDDIDDAPAEILLKWAEAQVDVMVERFPDDFEQACRWMRQLIKNINRFVGQRQFLDDEGYAKYMNKVEMWLPKLDYAITEPQIRAILPDDKEDMMANVKAIIAIIDEVGAVSGGDGQVGDQSTPSIPSNEGSGGGLEA